jgi:hypothetical protein
LKPVLDKSFTRPYLKKNPSQKKADGEAQGVGPEFKPQYRQKKKKIARKSPSLTHNSYNTTPYFECAQLANSLKAIVL